MVELYSTALISISVVVAGIIALKTRTSSSIFEVIIGILVANALGIGLAPWLDFLGTFGGLILTFLAGAEVELVLLKSRGKESFSIGFLAFLAPLLGVFFFLSLVTGWSFQAKLSASLALTTTSVAVVYAVLTEYDLMGGSIAKTIIASTFVNDILTLVGINLVAPSFDIITIGFVGLLVFLVFLVPRLLSTVVRAYGGRAVEIEFRLVLASLLGVSFFADQAKLHAVFGAFILGLIFANSIQRHQQVLSKLRTVTFGLLAPAFFVKAGMLVSLAAVSGSFLLLVGVLIAKLASKFIGTYWLCRKWIPEAPMFSTMLLSTGLTIGTITATLGRDLGFLDSTQFTITVMAVILSAIVPTLIAKRFVPTTKYG